MVNLKQDDGGAMMLESDYRPSQYPYGLCLNLNDDVCEKLGIMVGLAVGTVIALNAKAIVCRSTESIEQDGDDTGVDVSLEIQITDLEITTGEVLTNPAKELYGTA